MEGMVSGWVLWSGRREVLCGFVGWSRWRVDLAWWVFVTFEVQMGEVYIGQCILDIVRFCPANVPNYMQSSDRDLK